MIPQSKGSNYNYQDVKLHYSIHPLHFTLSPPKLYQRTPLDLEPHYIFGMSQNRNRHLQLLPLWKTHVDSCSSCCHDWPRGPAYRSWNGFHTDHQRSHHSYCHLIACCHCSGSDELSLGADRPIPQFETVGQRELCNKSWGAGSLMQLILAH